MKRVYPTVVAICIFMMAITLPRICFAQCSCSAGVPATPVDYYSSIPPSNGASTTFSFPKFNPSIGTLSCISFKDSVSGISTTNAQNKNPDTTVYKFLLNVANDIEGPSGGGISTGSTFSKTYGPDSLAPYNTPGDAITYGPDTLFYNVTDYATSTSTAPYQGAGNVTFTYSISGGVTSTKGGLNYTAGPTTVYWGYFHITYYWCPTVVLATSISDFTATANGNAILLQWLTNNEQNNNNYEIQVSTDGKQFSTAGQAESDPASAGATTKHQYQYNTDQAYVGKLYFRIKVTDASGKVSYSAILILQPGGSGDGSLLFQAYPNPATNTLIFQFTNNQTGRYLLELVNTAGQVVQQKSVTLTGANQIRLDLNPQPAKGLYFMRTKDLTHNQSYVSKVLIN